MEDGFLVKNKAISNDSRVSGIEGVIDGNAP